jgi:cell division protein FtsA
VKERDMAESDIVASLDIGATKICSAIGRIDERKRINIIGLGCSPPLGLESGIVADVELLAGSIERAVTEAEEMAGVEVESVFTGIAQSNLRGINSRGVVSIPGANREINSGDVNRVIEVAKVVAVRSTQESVQELVQEFIVDGQRGIKNPVGMYGFKLEAEVYIVTGKPSTFLKTVIECIKNAGFGVEEMVLEPLAAGEAVITPSEKKIGALLIDLGGETTCIAIFEKGNLTRARILALGVDKITSDIVGRFHLSEPAAEMIKRDYGCAVPSAAAADKKVDLPGNEETVISRKELSEIVQRRMGEILGLVKREAEGARFPMGMGESVVLTGGGALLEGITELAARRFNLPVRVGKPDGRVGRWGRVINSPAYSTVIGLLHSGMKNRQLAEMSNIGWQNPLIKIKKWFGEFF